MILFDSALDQAEIQRIMAGSIPDPAVVSAGKSYAYEKQTPHYSGGTYYYDDPHTETLGAFDTGEMTDGVYFPNGGTPTSPAQNALSGWGSPASVESDIILDLEKAYPITGVTLGTFTFSQFANGAPDDVTLSFSLDGITFGSPITQAFFAPPNNGHSDFVVNVPGTMARYVKLEFDGGAIGGGTANKWMLDEITVHAVPEPATLCLLGLAATGLGAYARRRRLG